MSGRDGWTGRADGDGAGGAVRLPVDPDLDPSPFGRGPRSRWPRIHWASVAAVAAGGFAGGIARYGVGVAWPTAAAGFPWGTFAVNTSGAFVLALLLVLVLEVLPPTRYLRPVLGTGFCGAFTTFSSVVTSVDQLATHGHADVASGYLAASVAAGLAAAAAGLVMGRALAAGHSQRQE